ncbi:MAG: 23S rRNA (adenine(2503)-C(2))-methyltransferase RlmN [Elusimicrobia bacterium]|nr:23S rRNA (adenine(2503)-C(2))-methyltransferase RlmN [Elusimicrobiota bacterium]
MTPIKSLSFDGLAEAAAELGEPAYRARQLSRWLYQKRADSFDAMGDLPKVFRAGLAKRFSAAKLDVRRVLRSKKGDAVKFAFLCADGRGLIESVALLDGKRRTACLSSQLGCALGCRICETGRMGFIRNLAQEEILGQLIGMNDYLWARERRLVSNIVFMGMGEALSNFENFRSSLAIIMGEHGFNLGGRKITVSTAGVAPSIERLMEEDLNVGLAISLNAYSNETRNRLMPINRKYPIETLIAAARRYFERTGRRVTFEYALIEGENDTPEAAEALEKLLKDLVCKINLIALSPCSARVKSPSPARVKAFSDDLHRRGLCATIRRSRGRDIFGACGQLGRRP